MSLSAKQVRFSSSNDEMTKTIDLSSLLREETDLTIPTRKFAAEELGNKPIDLSTLLKDNPSVTGLLPKKKKSTKKKSQLKKLKSEKRRLLGELKEVKKGIKEDSARKGSAEYSPYENRQRLARSTSEIHSKVMKLEEKLAVKQKLKREKTKRNCKTRIKERTIKAGKQHDRLIKMTSTLQDLKLDEGDIREEIRKERIISSAVSIGYRCPSNTYDMDPVEGQWVAISEPKYDSSYIASRTNDETERNNHESVSRCSNNSLEMARLSSSMSLTSGLSLEEKELKAEKMAKKYELTRDLRNIIHQHMISRSYSFSYTNIIPPYKHKQLKPMKTRQSYNRNIYEEKLNVVQYKKLQTKKLPAI